jgi:hypothetical protein
MSKSCIVELSCTVESSAKSIYQVMLLNEYEIDYEFEYEVVYEFDYKVDYDNVMFMIMICLDNPMMLHDYC